MKKHLSGFVWIAGIVTVFVLMVLMVSSELEEDTRREVICAEMGGYIERDTSMCRDRKSDDVLATWKELGEK